MNKKEIMMIELKSPTQKLISWTAVLIWMILIFNLSSQVADQSNQLSRGVTGVIVETVQKFVPDVEDFDLGRFNHLLRKNAHFFMYLILGVLVMNAMRKIGLSGMKSFMFSLLICILYAVSDEVHQLLVLGRGGQVKDVMIDNAGAILGIGMYALISKIIKSRTLSANKIQRL